MFFYFLLDEVYVRSFYGIAVPAQQKAGVRLDDYAGSKADSAG